MKDLSGRAGGTPLITDGPRGDIYGYSTCVYTNVNPFNVTSLYNTPTTIFAEPYTILAKSKRIVLLLPLLPPTPQTRSKMLTVFLV